MVNSQAGKRFWSIILKRNALTFGILFVLGVLIDLYFFDPYERSHGWAGLVAIVIYVIAIAGIGLINILSGVAYAWLFQDKDLEDLVLNDIRNANLPGPDEYQQKRFDYLVELADDEDLPADVRIRAAALHASYQVAIQRAGMFNGLALARALDSAALRFSQETPKR